MFARKNVTKACGQIGFRSLTVPEPRHAVVFNLPEKNRARMIVLLCFERLWVAAKMRPGNSDGDACEIDALIATRNWQACLVATQGGLRY